MEAGAGGHLDSLQVETMTLSLGLKHYLEKRLDFPCDFLMNSSSRFFRLRPARRIGRGRAQTAESAHFRGGQFCTQVLKAVELGDFLKRPCGTPPAWGRTRPCSCPSLCGVDETKLRVTRILGQSAVASRPAAMARSRGDGASPAGCLNDFGTVRTLLEAPFRRD